MNTLTAEQQQAYLSFVEASLQLASRSDFVALIETHVKPLLPHRISIAGVGRILPDYRIQTFQLLPIGYPMSYLKAVQQPGGGIQSPIMTRWATSREPQWFNPAKDKSSDITAEWLRVYRRYRLGNQAAHGVHDLYSDVTSYFSFCGVPDSPQHQYALILRLLVPHLHMALLQALTREREAEEEKRSPNKTLTTRERKLLALLLSGKSNQEMAEALERSEKTIKNQLHVLYGKLQVRTRGQAIHRANSLRGENLVNTRGSAIV